MTLALACLLWHLVLGDWGIEIFEYIFGIGTILGIWKAQGQDLAPEIGSLKKAPGSGFGAGPLKTSIF